MKANTTIATIATLIALCFSGLNAGAADKAKETALDTLGKIANSSKPEAQVIYRRVISAVEKGADVTAFDKGVLKKDRALFEKRGKPDAVEAIDFVIKSARGGNARPTVNKVSTTTLAETLVASATAFRQIDGDLENGEVSGDREAKLKLAIEAGISAVEGDPFTDAQDNAERLSLAADKAERDAKGGQMSADDTEDAVEIAGAYRVLASALLNSSSSSSSAVTTPNVPEPPALPATVPTKSAAASVPAPAPARADAHSTHVTPPNVPGVTEPLEAPKAVKEIPLPPRSTTRKK